MEEQFSPKVLKAVAAAIKAAECHRREGPYGLYDYSIYEGYKGIEKPYCVRDFRCPQSDSWGSVVFRSSAHDEAFQVFNKLTDEHIAQAAIKAYLEATSKDD